jgi:hypothetical protein
MGKLGPAIRLSRKKLELTRRLGIVHQVHLHVVFAIAVTSVEDPDPSDPHVFGPPGSGSISQRYGSGSGSFYHHAKIVPYENH